MSNVDTTWVRAQADEAAKRVEFVRKGFAEMVERGEGSNAFAQQANALATAEGAHYVWARLVMVIEYGECDGNTPATAQHLRDVATEAVLHGADDEWSGRTNDAKRARFDGIRAAVTKALEIL